MQHIDLHIPDEMLQDYLSLYPPTVDIKKSDFDLTKNFHEKIRAVYEYHILELENVRGASDKFEEFETMNKQCFCEEAIRSWTGMDENGKYKGCPITLIDDPTERRNAYSDLVTRALATTIKESYVFMSPYKPISSAPRYAVKTRKESEDIADHLGLTFEALEKHYRENKEKPQ